MMDAEDVRGWFATTQGFKTDEKSIYYKEGDEGEGNAASGTSDLAS